MFHLSKIVKMTSIRWKLLGAFFAVGTGMVVIAGAAVILQLSAVKRAAYGEAERIAMAVASDEVQWANPGRLERYVQSLGKLFERDIFLIDGASTVLASTNPMRVGTSYKSPQIDAAFRTGTSQDFIGPDATDPAMARQVVVPLPAGTLPWGAAGRGAVVFEYTKIYDAAMQEASRSAALTAFAACLLSVLGYVFATRFTEGVVSPLAELENASGALAEDDFTARLVPRGHDEISRVAVAFNKMADKMSHSVSLLQERNTDLATANQQLQAEAHKQTAAAKRIEFLAFHDSLTLLPNRASFSLALTRAVTRHAALPQRFAVLFLDLDRFKQINDTLGHEAGDQLLQEMGQRLQRNVGAEDLVARLGGDEFVLMLDGMSDEREVGFLAQRLLAEIAKPFQIGSQELRVTASIGISLFSRDGNDEQTLMKNADIAMYQAKEKGRNAFAFYSADRDHNSYAQLALESGLRRALSRDELFLNYQPKADLRTGRITGMEALLRWQHPELGTVSPAQFIPLAEDTGLIVPIGKWVLRTACKQTVHWKKLGIDGLVVAVNLSPRQFSDDDLLVDIVSILSETGMDATDLELEITEGAIMQDPDRGRRMMASLKAMGIRIAVDDFGTGYSSLATLKQFPIDTLKIDRAFIRDLATDQDDRSLTEAIISMGKALNMHIVAEGVETREQLDFLKERGCDSMQGYLLSKPLSALDFESMVVNAQRRVAA